MAANFKISTHSNSENIHLQLIGDFDGISAHKLLEVLENSCRNMNKVFIHTNRLNRIHPLGFNTFKQHLKSKGSRNMELVFTGDHASCMNPN